MFHGLVMCIAPAMLVVQTDRGDEMFMTLLERYAQQAIDLGSLDLLPEPGARPAPLQPSPEDEGRHSPGPEPLWNESWYFDVASESGDLGVYLRLGRLPNQDHCHYMACICGPDRPTVMIVEEAPLPDAADDAQVVDKDGLHAEHHCEEPLERFRVTFGGEGRTHEDPAAILRRGRGRSRRGCASTSRGSRTACPMPGGSPVATRSPAAYPGR